MVGTRPDIAVEAGIACVCRLASVSVERRGRTRSGCASQPAKELSVSDASCGNRCAVVRQMGRVWWMISVLALCCTTVACRPNQNQSRPVIEFTKVPRASVGGPDRTDIIEGRVIRARPGQRIVLFAQWGTWYVQPLADQPFTTIQPDSKWRNLTHFGLQYAALLVDGDYQPPARIESLPSPGHGVVAVAVVNGRPAFWQTWWFLLTVTLASVAIVSAYFLQRIVLLAGEEKRFREAMESIPAMAFVTRPDGYCTFVNKGWVEFTGLTVEQTSESGWQSAVHPDDLSRVVTKWRASLASGESFEREIRIHRVAGEAYRWFLMRAVPLRDKGGKILKWCGAATDIEDRKQAEQLRADLAHVSRVSTMGELVASISHELLQPIAACTINGKSALRWLQCNPPDVANASKSASAIVKDGLRAGEILERLRSLYKKVPPKREPVAVNDLINEMVVLLRSEANLHGVSIRTDLQDDLPTAAADRVQLQQVLMNLMLNGIEAMGNAGSVLTVASQLRQDGQIQISVNDTGLGLPPGKGDEIFQPFFTTKSRGSGMGLAISKSIIESNGGRIWANGEEGRGATFCFTLSRYTDTP
jgi:PAS domain S-box-containing protein